MFADDTKLYANPLTHYTQITKDLEALNLWCSDWLLPLNSDKCTVLHLGKNNPILSYNIAGVPLTVLDYQNDLGKYYYFFQPQMGTTYCLDNKKS